MPEPERARWRDLVERRLPEAARAAREVRADWPVHRDHCFARILLDNTCNGPWRDSVAAPAWANMPLGDLRAAIALGEAVLSGRADLARLNRRSLRLRGKAAPAGRPVPEALSGDGFRLRRWTGEAIEALVDLNADPEVMRCFPAMREAQASRREAQAFEGSFRADGFGPWALEVPGEGFVGLVGATRLMRVLPFPGGERPAETMELVWRLARAAWGRGLATRGARLALADLSGRCGVAEVVAFTAEANEPSRRVMERLGMRSVGGFHHPSLPLHHPLAPHLLYRLCAADGPTPEGLVR